MRSLLYTFLAEKLSFLVFLFCLCFWFTHLYNNVTKCPPPGVKGHWISHTAVLTQIFNTQTCTNQEQCAQYSFINHKWVLLSSQLSLWHSDFDILTTVELNPSREPRSRSAAHSKHCTQVCGQNFLKGWSGPYGPNPSPPPHTHILWQVDLLAEWRGALWVHRTSLGNRPCCPWRGS